MSTYSAFFSSGLLAPHLSSNTANSSTYPYYGTPSPVAPPSPLPLADDSDIEVDRSVTPTGPPTSTAAVAASAAPPTRPYLRKRRSSLTVATSPMNAIKSPTRTAGAALQLQRHLSPSRARSGSLNVNMNMNASASHSMGGDVLSSAYGLGVGNIASEGTSLVGRMRSGSVGGLRPRRYIRRTISVPVQAPAPPPTAPLPALPALCPSSSTHPHSAPPHSRPRTPLAICVPAQSLQSRALPTPNHMELDAKPPLSPNLLDESPVDKAWSKQGRERGHSVGNSNRIDEEMKEN